MAAEEAEGVADIFTLMAAQQAEILRHEPPQRDSELLFLGSTQSGKSTLVNSFLKVEENPPKPTTALEYRFARPADATGAASVCNVWELAGGTQLSELLKVVLLPEKLEACVVAITLDLSAPGDALETMLFWFEQIRKHVGLSLQQVAASGPGGAEKAMALRERANEAWSDHPDRDDLRPLGIPVMVFAHKWDVFEEEYGEAEYRKVLTRALRYFAHTNGASLMCTHHKDKSMLSIARKLINHHVFDMPALKSVQLEHNKPLVVPVTADSFAGIGPPPQVEGVISDDKGDKWKAAFEAFFPAKREKKDAQDQAVMVDAEQFAEETVDDLRRAKQEELFKLRAQMHGEASAIPS